MENLDNITLDNIQNSLKRTDTDYKLLDYLIRKIQRHNKSIDKVIEENIVDKIRWIQHYIAEIVDISLHLTIFLITEENDIINKLILRVIHDAKEVSNIIENNDVLDRDIIYEKLKNINICTNTLLYNLTIVQKIK